MDHLVLRPGIGVSTARVNQGFVAGTDGVLVVDTMNSPADGREISAFVLSHCDVPLRAVVCTHNHADHTFGSQVFEAPVIAHDLCRQIMAGNLAGPWSEESLRSWFEGPGGDRLSGLEIRLPDVTFSSRITFHLGKSPAGGDERVAIVEHTGGHSPGHAIVRVPDAGVIFGGDLFFVGRYPFVRQGHMPTWTAALERIKELAPEVLIPGHGPICDGVRALAEANRHSAYFRETRGLLAEMISRGLAKEEILARAGEFPRFADEGYERLHEVNIERMYGEVVAEEAGA